MNKTSFLKKFFLLVLQQIYYKPLFELGKAFMQQTKLFPILAHHWSLVLNTMIFTKKQIYFITFLVFLIPRYELALSLILDIFILKKIYIFYNILWIICLPLIVEAILGLTKIYIENNKFILEMHYLTIITKDNVQEFFTKQNINQSIFQELILKWIFYVKILDIINAIELCKKTYYYLFYSMIPIISFTICWGYYSYCIIISKIDYQNLQYLYYE